MEMKEEHRNKKLSKTIQQLFVFYSILNFDFEINQDVM